MAEAIAELEGIVSKELAGVGAAWAEVPLRSGRQLDLPDWYQAFRDQSWQEHCTLPDPSRTDEAWRFATLSRSKFKGLGLAAPLAPDQGQALLEQSVGVQESSGRVVFANNVELARDTKGLPEGVVCLPINEALAQHGERVRESFMQEDTRLGGKKFAALHRAGELSGVFIFVPDGVEVERPVEVFHWLGGGDGSVILPHTLIVTGAGARISVVEHYRSVEGGAAGLSLGMGDILTGAGSKVDYASVQSLNAQSRQVQIGSTKVGEGAAVKTALVNLGGAWVRNENVSRMLGSGARSDMLSLSLAAGDAEIDQRTLQLHEVENTESDLFYKNALYDRTRAIFAGVISVEPGAHHTDAFQTCRNLLGSDEAEANSMPGLEIGADQVRCSHGATTGSIDPEQLFYCLARGISEHVAKKLISFGFLNDVVKRIDDDFVKEMVKQEVEAAFARVV